MAYQFKTSFGAAGLAAGSTQMDLPRRLTNEISGTGDIDLFQVLRKGDYLYGVDNNVFTLGTKITEITDLTAKVRIKFNKPTAAAVANEDGFALAVSARVPKVPAAVVNEGSGE